VKAKGTIFAVVYRRVVPRLGHAQAIGAITHRLCRLIWKILHERVRDDERGPAVSVEAKKVRARKMIRELRGLGYRVELVAPFRRPERFSTLVSPGPAARKRSIKIRVPARMAPAGAARSNRVSGAVEAELFDPERA
jgi:hypothetical protein